VATGFDETNRIAGVFETTGIVPRCLDRMRLAGIEMPSRLFEQARRPGGAR
jgi:hypothetical protein